ncbi:MAG: FHA domain-containing protein [Azonexus sp.]|jgi:pSer/pThr/pTyr-binding forkhead associated (FHA) protein|uniref:FHA domain-containing protein n=1 Tax=Azonexus sp. TaxID=1872668 RepID=UPI002838BAB6|nr:FHA domain-containing protein [Azonexus sp.]MDR0775728.1 FHA domain-containing protein [Azonexus sp.]
MAKLILSMDGLVLKEIVLDKKRLSIGRKPNNDVQIDNLAISGEHAVIVTILNDAFLEDLNSTNGTLVNGQPIKKCILHNNDIIELGKYRLKFMAVEPEPHSDFEKTGGTRQAMARLASEMELLPIEGAPTRSRPGVPLPPSQTGVPPAPSIPGAAAIQLLNGPNVGKELPLTKTLTTLGKPGQQVAVIARRPQGYFITHVEGKEFPVLNGQSLNVQAHPLGDHDIIEIAGIKMEFFLKA